jgi:hypothetical protein
MFLRIGSNTKRALGTLNYFTGSTVDAVVNNSALVLHLAVSAAATTVRPLCVTASDSGTQK